MTKQRRTGKTAPGTTAPLLDTVGGGAPGVRRKPGPRPDPAKKGFTKHLVTLGPGHFDALRKAALERELAGKERRADASGVLRLLLDRWIRQGAKAP
jgi:hypothetical protein